MQNSRAHTREIVILSGKGGTGKTTVTASLAVLLKNKLIADCDVEASNLYMVMGAEEMEAHEFYGGIIPWINKEGCTQCKICVDVCEFEAIHPETLSIDEISCEGCGVCHWFCPENCIMLKERHCGRWYVGESRYGPMVYAELFPGEENSGKLVHAMKEAARSRAEEMGVDIILVDGPPGIACPVISTLSGADLALIITEPTLSGLSDLKRILDLCAHFRVPAYCIINKFDIFPGIANEINAMLEKKGIPLLGELPFDQDVIQANMDLVPFVEAYPNRPLTRSLHEIAQRLSVL